jgi:hypothetical protein
MPVESKEVGSAPATIRFEQPEGPFEVTAEHGQESTGFHEVETGNEEVSVDWHDQTPSGLVEQGSGETVRLEGFGNDGDDVKAAPKKAAQKKVVSSPKRGSAGGTDGAETK